ncbi:MAG TPA: fatty acid metabolism transcriptional regulator FadR [Anaerolineae bacterium]
MNWDIPQRPAELAETRLINAILDDKFPIDSPLPPERDLATQLGVTRPTLREALQRLARDGWLEIRHGKPTRVRNYWHEGNLAVLSAIARHRDHLPQDFVPNLLQVRALIAPAYTRMAIEKSAGKVCKFLQAYVNLPDTAEAFAHADWELHSHLAKESGNPIFILILNGFKNLYPMMARIYFKLDAARARSRRFYADLLAAAEAGKPAKAEAILHQIMRDSIELWQIASKKRPTARSKA